MILRLRVPSVELYDDAKEEFVNTKEYNLSLQHSLISIAKWESRWTKPFLETENKTLEETLDYVKCMTITQNVPDVAYEYLSEEVLNKIKEHIKAPMTATTIAKQSGGGNNKEIVTAEIIYYWMVALDIPMECQTWHINRLLTLINVCNIKNNPPKKMGKQDAMAQQRRLNQQRKEQMQTKG